MEQERNGKGSSAGNVSHRECVLGEGTNGDSDPKGFYAGKCNFLVEIGEACHKPLLLRKIFLVSGAVLFLLPSQTLKVGLSFLVCFLILGLPFSVAAAHHVCLNQAGLIQGLTDHSGFQFHPI